MSTKAPGEILELFRGGYLSIAETIDALDAVEGYVSVELLNIERAISDDLREQNAKLREAAATPAVGGEEGADSVMVPKSALAWLFGEAPDSDGKWFGERDPGPLAGKYPRKYWWRSTFRTMISAAPPASPLRGRDELHPDTQDLVEKLSWALEDKLLRSQKKYGYTNEWLTDDWKDECQLQLMEHLKKGDPLDVVAYAAFMWARGWPT